MATNFLWAGAGSYVAGPTNWLTTELNSLATSTANTLSAASSAVQNTGGLIYAECRIRSWWDIYAARQWLR